MAINFPDGPVNGDTHVVGNVTYVYNNAKNKWVGAGQTPIDRLAEGSGLLDIENNTLRYTGGNFGLGTTNPIAKLDVRGYVMFGPDGTTNQYQGLSLRNGRDSSANISTSYVDFRNDLNTPDGHIFVDHNTDGSSVMIFGATPAGDRTIDRRSERLRITSANAQFTGRIFINGTEGGFDYNNIANTLEFLTTDGSTHSELNANAYVPQGTKNLGSNGARWNTLYIANGIDFAGNDNASGMTSEVLDDYEEGNWTPVIKSGANTITATGGNQYYTYTKVGNKVTVYFALDGGTTSGTTGGDFTIQGLPFAMTPDKGGNRTMGSVLMYYSSGLRAAQWPTWIHVNSSSTTLDIYEKSGVANSYGRATVGQVGANSYVFGQITYNVE